MIVRAQTQKELEAARVTFLGRKSPLVEALRNAKNVEIETRAEMNRTKLHLEALVTTMRTEVRRKQLDRSLTEEEVDVTLPGEELPLGHLHPTTHIRRLVEDAFLGLGYQIYDDREVEWVEDNFDKLAFPEWHPTRSPRDTFFFDERRVLRTETSPSQIHVMQEQKPPIYMVSIGRVYRRDEITATRFPIFHQFEGLAVDRGITLADLKGTLLHVMRALFGQERAVRFRTHYFPFTEPSIEPDVSCPVCDSEGCRTCKFTGWIELGGAGMVGPAVFENVGLDPGEWSGFAFGCGLERSAQLRFGIPEIRPFWESDLRVLTQF